MKKRISILLVLVMLFAFYPLTGSAASTNTMDRVLRVARNADLSTMANTPVLKIEDRDNSFNGQVETFRLLLPHTAEWVAAALNINASGGSSINNQTLLDPQTLQIQATLQSGAVLTVEMNVKLKDALGEQKVTIDRRESALSGDSLTFAIAEVGQTVTFVTRDNLYEGGFAEVGSIIIEETVKGTVTGPQVFRLRLPTGFEWNPDHATPANVTLGGFLHNENDVQAALTVAIGNSNRDMTVTFVAFEGSTLPGAIVVKPSIRALRTAAYGDVSVTLTGQNDISNATGLVIADYKEATYTITSKTQDEEFIAGRANGYTATLNIAESVPETLLRNRYIDVELPSWVRIVHNTNVRVDINNVAQAGTNTNSFRFLLLPNANWMDNGMFDFDITFDFVVSGVATIDGPMDIPVTLVGAGINDKISIGTAISAITIEVTQAKFTYLQAGLQNQSAPEIIVTENFPGALRTGDLKFAAVGGFANSVRFENIDVEVLEGDIEIGNISTERDAFWFEVDVDSEVASVIRIHGVEVTMDRTVPDGTFTVDVLGSAVLDQLNHAHTNFPERVYRIEPYFMVGVPPAVPTNTVAFTLRSSAYTVNGQLRQMDVAPYIRNDRMMIPVRYLAELFGTQPVWNPENKTVSILFDNQVFEMTIGSAVLTANGEPVLEMDVSAEITGNRTFVPASRFARAMGIKYTFDEETRTAVFN